MENMTKVLLYEYDVLQERNIGRSAAAVRSNARFMTSGGEFNHLAVIVHGKEFYYGQNGILVSMEPVNLIN